MFLATILPALDEPDLVFEWAFIKQPRDGSAISIDLSERLNIMPWDKFKIYMQPKNRAYLYLFFHSADGSLELLFPDHFEVFETPTYPNMIFFIPSSDKWFTLDEAKGIERFYLLASTTRLRSLESLTVALRKATANTKATPESLGAARQAVLEEIGTIRKKNSQLTMAAEKPVPIAGGSRGPNTSIESMATRIEATGFYTRTLRLEH